MVATGDKIGTGQIETLGFEGTEVPFLFWTDHKNLEYLKSAKRLNARQARWSLSFSHFNFSLSFRPGIKNTKPDALRLAISHQRVFSDHSQCLTDPGHILL